ncbi:MAG TPA: tRNA uridine-5-carboxymethylaminomethyl(34) synthesis GTPase MnmE [Candidatus Omnitrophota bacterium]|nr:tRNA uridine-5-carboxymethylaminomethyl(34) synthesis GTPase MnmE [Candidatus Omnitrophota bacterium]HQJ14884.1 tRNA uridine-5-carboxymethylaminomethyl(34) synthesis GTPase MnmE [Candidatus Omnitrophota bacterium]
MKHHDEETIAAIATAPGEAGIGIVRMSGNRAIEIAESVFRAADKTRLENQPTHTIRYGWIVQPKPASQADPGPQGRIVDEVLVTVMRAPRTFTREDVVEINCHGGIVAMRRVLELLLEAGCRIAEPGEFTRRAFLNGRIDLAQAEAVLDVISAKTDAALAAGVGQLRGMLSRRISVMRKRLLEMLAVLEANIDFPDEDLEPADTARLKKEADSLDAELGSILARARHGSIMREGVRTVICGRPNVGKSSLLNALLQKERSIVTPVAGTTRDVIEDFIDIKGIPIRIMDTAGLLEPRDLVERKAVARARECMRQADLILLVLDGTRPLDSGTRGLFRLAGKAKTIAVINKIDLARRLRCDDIAALFSSVVEVSARRMKNIDKLEDEIASFVLGGNADFREPLLVSNMRHIRALRDAQKSIARLRISLDNGVSAELTAQHIKEALGSFDGLLGRRFSEDLLDSIFSRFCIGK